MAGLSSDEENKTKSQKKSNLQSESPKKDSKYKPEKPDFIQKHNEPHYNGEKNILMDSPQRPMENFNFTKPVARIGDDYDDLIEQMEDEEFKGETERIPR